MKSNTTKELTLTQRTLQEDLNQHIKKIGKELERIYILSEDQKDKQCVMISMEEYNDLLKGFFEYQHIKESAELSTAQMFASLQKDIATIKEDVYILKIVK